MCFHPASSLLMKPVMLNSGRVVSCGAVVQDVLSICCKFPVAAGTYCVWVTLVARG